MTMRRYPSIEKVLVRALVCVIDNFHFDATSPGDKVTSDIAPAGADGGASDEENDEQVAAATAADAAAVPVASSESAPTERENPVHRALATVFKRALVGLLEVGTVAVAFCCVVTSGPGAADR